MRTREGMAVARAKGKLRGKQPKLSDKQQNDLRCMHDEDRVALARYLAPTRKPEWVVYSKRPFGGPEAVLAYLSRYTHRVAISNSRLLACDSAGVAFKYKDYRAKGRARQKVMRLAKGEFIRRFLIHVLPTGFHRIRHYGLFASGVRAQNIARARELLGTVMPREHDRRPRTAINPSRAASRIHARAAAAA